MMILSRLHRKDPNQYILRYQILRQQKAPVEQQIEALEEYKKSEYVEEWAYETRETVSGSRYDC